MALDFGARFLEVVLKLVLKPVYPPLIVQRPPGRVLLEEHSVGASLTYGRLAKHIVQSRGKLLALRGFDRFLSLHCTVSHLDDNFEELHLATKVVR
jgi:hypothetical protein